MWWPILPLPVVRGSISGFVYIINKPANTFKLNASYTIQRHSCWKNLNFSIIFREIYDYQGSFIIHQPTKLLLTEMVIFTTESDCFRAYEAFLGFERSLYRKKMEVTTFLVRLQTFRWQPYWIQPITLIAYVGWAFIYFHLILLLKCSLMYDLRRYGQILGFVYLTWDQ